jgi:hypothetical protein
MLVRSLGHGQLTFPHGYRQRAERGDVRLIGNFVATPGFEFRNQTMSARLTRENMAMLLYNYLHSNYRRIHMNWTGAGGVWEASEDFESVWRVFGIQDRIGYVTGVPYWYMDLIVDNSGFATPIPAEFANEDLRRDPHDLFIGWLPRLDVNYNLGHGASYTNNLGITMANNNPIGPAHRRNRSVLGWTDYELEDLLGKKVIVYDDLRPAEARSIPRARVLGTKVNIDPKDASVKLGGDTWDRLDALDSANVNAGMQLRLGAIEEFRFGANAYDVGNSVMEDEFRPGINLYIHNSGLNSGRTISASTLAAAIPGGSQAGGTVAERNLREFATFVDRSSNYRLTFIDNGEIAGFPDYAYIFEPFRVGMYTRNNDDGNVQMMQGNAVGDDNADLGVKPADATIMTKGKDVVFPDAEWVEDATGFFTTGHAYFYTIYGNVLRVYGQLERITGTTLNARPNMRTGRFTVPTGVGDTTEQKTYNFEDVGRSALFARRSVLAGTGAVLGNNYTMFLDPATQQTLLIRDTTPGREKEYSRYGVVMSVVGFNGSPLTVAGSTVGATIRIFDAEGANSQGIGTPLFVTHVNGRPVTRTLSSGGGVMDQATRLGTTRQSDGEQAAWADVETLRIGDYIRIVGTQVFTPNDADWGVDGQTAITAARNRFTGQDEYFAKDTRGANTDDVYNRVYQTGTLVDLAFANNITIGTVSGADDVIATATGNNAAALPRDVSARIDNNTRIIVFSDGDVIETRKITPATLRAQLRNVTAKMPDGGGGLVVPEIWGLTLVGKDGWLGSAHVVFVTIEGGPVHASPPVVETGTYGVILGPSRFGDMLDVSDGALIQTYDVGYYNDAREWKEMIGYVRGSAQISEFVKLVPKANNTHYILTHEINDFGIFGDIQGLRASNPAAASIDALVYGRNDYTGIMGTNDASNFLNNTGTVASEDANPYWNFDFDQMLADTTGTGGQATSGVQRVAGTVKVGSFIAENGLIIEEDIVDVGMDEHHISIAGIKEFRFLSIDVTDGAARINNANRGGTENTGNRALILDWQGNNDDVAPNGDAEMYAIIYFTNDQYRRVLSLTLIYVLDED